MSDDDHLAALDERLAHAYAAGLITSEQCVDLAMAASGVSKGDGQPGSNVREWRRGDSADAGDADARHADRDLPKSRRGARAIATLGVGRERRVRISIMRRSSESTSKQRRCDHGDGS